MRSGCTEHEQSIFVQCVEMTSTTIERTPEPLWGVLYVITCVLGALLVWDAARAAVRA